MKDIVKIILLEEEAQAPPENRTCAKDEQ